MDPLISYILSSPSSSAAPLLPIFFPKSNSPQFRRRRRLPAAKTGRITGGGFRREPPEFQMSVSVAIPHSLRRDGEDEPLIASVKGLYDSRLNAEVDVRLGKRVLGIEWRKMCAVLDLPRTRRGDMLTTKLEDEEGASIRSPPRNNSNSKSVLKLFGVDMSPDTVAVAMVYFVQGVLGLSRLAVSFYFKDNLHLDPAETAVISGFSAFPWLVKPLYGFVSDSLPLFGYRRRSYLVLSGLIGALAWTLMCTVVEANILQRFVYFSGLFQLPSLML
ncbi:Folate-biopterin transporter 1, chloroplastic-like protein [Drosera capensis]